jgi:4-diphosphocytidyl-2-C-methyl-D-erythritol kinase
VRSLAAHAKINLALVVGDLASDGRHEVATVIERIGLADRITVEPAERLAVTGFEGDTIVSRALCALAAAAGIEPRWRAEISKSVPVAAGLGGGSSDAASALRLANDLLPEPLGPLQLSELAAGIGADVPFFLTAGPQLGARDGTVLAPLDLPRDYCVVLLMPRDAAKTSTADVYGAFDARNGAVGFEQRRAELLEMLAEVRGAEDLGRLPANDLASSPLADELLAAGAFRADVSGAGPCIYGLFRERAAAAAAALALQAAGRTWVTAPA